MAAVDLQRISREASQVQFRRVLLTAIAFLFYGLGWLAAKFFVVLWRAAVWSFVAVKLGWQDGMKPKAGVGATR